MIVVCGPTQTARRLGSWPRLPATWGSRASGRDLGAWAVFTRSPGRRSLGRPGAYLIVRLRALYLRTCEYRALAWCSDGNDGPTGWRGATAPAHQSALWQCRRPFGSGAPWSAPIATGKCRERGDRFGRGRANARATGCGIGPESNGSRHRPRSGATARGQRRTTEQHR